MLFVLKHLIRRANIFNAAKDNLEHIKLFEGYPDMDAVFDVACNYHNMYNKLPAFGIYEMELQMSYEERGMTHHAFVEIMRLVREWFDQKEGWSDEAVQDYLYDVFKGSAYDELQQADSDDPDAVGKAIDKASKAFNTNPFDGLKIENPFTNIAHYVQEAARRPTNLPFMDRILDGGLCVGESIGILAPSGGGKTTMGLQFAAGQVEQEEHVLYLSTEQALRGDLAVRLFVLASRAERADFRYGYKGLSPDILNTLDKVSPLWEEYFHFVDCYSKKDNIKSIDDIFTPLNELIEAGKRPKLVIIDWWGRLRDYLTLNNKDSARSDSDQRMMNRNWLHRVKKSAENKNLSVVVLHQLAGSEAGKSAKHVASSHKAQEDSNFNNMFDWAFVLSKKDSTDMVTMVADKARAAANTKVSLHLDGPHCKFTTGKDLNHAVEDLTYEADTTKVAVESYQ
jgi:RecA/RadA recombinase